MTQKKGGLGSVRKDNTTMHELSSWGRGGEGGRGKGEKGLTGMQAKAEGWGGGGWGKNSKTSRQTCETRTHTQSMRAETAT